MSAYLHVGNDQSSDTENSEIGYDDTITERERLTPTSEVPYEKNYSEDVWRLLMFDKMGDTVRNYWATTVKK
jgi:hypothetical protein